MSAALKPEGLQRTVLLLAISKPAKLYVSRPIIEEYRSVLSRPTLRIAKGNQRRLLQMILNCAHTVSPLAKLHAARDPDDDIFVECADAARADYLITGNISHFPRFWKQTKIITSREFTNVVAPHMLG